VIFTQCAYSSPDVRDLHLNRLSIGSIHLIHPHKDILTSLHFVGQIKVAFQQALPQMPRKADPVLTGKGASEKKDDLVPPSQPIMPKFQLPAQYANPATSGISFELKQPVQEWSIDLK
jgi:hypothetical protein